MLRKLIAVGALVLAAMCLAVPAAYADVDFVLDELVTIDLVVVPADFVVVAIEPAVDLAVPILADLPGAGDGEDEPIAAMCPITGNVTSDPVPLRIDDPGWCLS